MNLSWKDLFLDAQQLNFERIFAEWTWLITGRVRPIEITAFGDMILEKPDGSIAMIDLIEGNLTQLAENFSEFQIMINKREYQEQWLLSLLVYSLRSRGMKPGNKQCYAFKQPPALGGSVSIENVEIMDTEVYVSLSGQLHRQIKGLG